MLASFRRLTKSKVGPIFAVLFLLTILASFALADIQSLNLGGGGLNRGTLAKVGDVELTENDLQTALQRRLTQLREQKPDATYADIASDFDAIVNGLIQERTLWAYARKHGLTVSKRLVDAEIAKIPGLQGLDGRFSDANYRAFLQQQRLTDAQVRREIETLLLQRMIVTPVAANARIPTGVARPYASMLLEQRQGDIAFIPARLFAGGAAPTDAELQAFYNQNRTRYTVPEQRVLRIARMGPEQLGNVTPTEQEITAYYNANRATYEGSETRVLSRASVGDQAAAAQIAQRAKAGGTFAAAAAPAGFSAADVSLGPQTRQQLASLAGEAVANQVFGAAQGAVIGPVQSSTGWDVIKIEGINRSAGKSLAQARAEIAAKLAVDKRKEALADLAGKVEDQIADGSSFAEVAAANRLPILETPPLTRAGVAPNQPAFKLPVEYQELLKFGFDMDASADPEVHVLPNDAGDALLAVGNVVPAAPAPLAQIRDRVAADFVAKRALDLARAAASAVLAKARGNVSLTDAVAQSGVTGLPKPESISLRRVQLSQFQGNVPAPLQMLFTLAPGKAQITGAPEGQGFFVVKLNGITPGDATTQPTLIAQVQGDFNRAAGEELAVQWINAAQKELGIKRDEAAIAAARQRLISGS